MRTAFHFVLRSWQLPWQEMILYVYPLLFIFGVVIAAIFANGLGIESYAWDIRYTNPDAPLSDQDFELVESVPFTYQIYSRLVYGALLTFFTAAAVATALRSLDDPDISIDKGLKIALFRLVTLLALTVIGAVIEVVLGWLPELWAILSRLILGLPLVLMLPVIIVEGGENWIGRSLQLARRALGTLLVSYIALLVSVALPIGLVALLFVNDQIGATFAVLLVLVFGWLAFPVGCSYQALLYQHARQVEKEEQAART